MESRRTPSPGLFSTVTYDYAGDDAKLRGLPSKEMLDQTKTGTVDEETSFKYDRFGRVRLETDEALASTQPTKSKIVHDYNDDYSDSANSDSADAPPSSTNLNYALCEKDTTDREGLVVERTCSSNGLVESETVKVRDGDHRTTTWSYTELGRLESVRYPNAPSASVKTEYSYDDAGRRILKKVPESVDSNGNPVFRTTSFAYTPQGYLKTETLPDPDGSSTDKSSSVTTYTYDEVGNAYLTKDARNNDWKVKFSAHNLPVTETDPKGNVTTTAHDVAGNARQTTAPTGTAQYRTFDALGRLRWQRAAARDIDGQGGPDAYASPMEYTYNARGDLIKKLLPAPSQGAFRSYVERDYDAAGRVISEIRPVAQHDTYEPGSTGDCNNKHADGTSLGADEAKRCYIRNGSGFLVKSVNFKGRIVDYSRDAMGRLTGVTTPHTGTAQSTTTYTRNKAGEVESVVIPRSSQASTSVSYTYDSMGRQASMTDGVGNETISSYNLVGELIRVQQEDGKRLLYGYDHMGRQISRKAEKDCVTSGGTTTCTPIAGSEETFDYDLLSNMTHAIHPGVDGSGGSERDENAVVMQYDMLNRLTHVKEGTTATDAKEVVKYVYGPDVIGGQSTGSDILLKERVDLGGTSQPRSSIYGYDQFGRVAAIGDPLSGGTTSYTYDAAQRTATRTDPNGLVHTFGYDKANRPDSDVARRQGVDVAKFESRFDAMSSVVRREQLVTGSTDNGVWTYSYKPAGMLEKAEGPTNGSNPYEYFYDYDFAGNRTQVVTKEMNTSDQIARTTDFTYNNAGRLETSTESTKTNGQSTGTNHQITYTYDVVGNLTAQSKDRQGFARFYGYDAWARMTRASEKLSPDLLAVDATVEIRKTYLHDALDRTIRKTNSVSVLLEVPSPLPTGPDYVIDPTKLDVETTSTQYFFAGTDEAQLLESVEHVGEQPYDVAPSSPLPVEVVRNSYSHNNQGPMSVRKRIANTPDTVRVLGLNPHGDVAYLTRATSASPLPGDAGDPMGWASYGPYGEPRVGEGDTTELGYQADVTDPDTGLVDMGARMYDPSLGMFTANDPVKGSHGTPLTLLRYMYGAGDPLTNIDPDGRTPIAHNNARDDTPEQRRDAHEHQSENGGLWTDTPDGPLPDLTEAKLAGYNTKIHNLVVAQTVAMIRADARSWGGEILTEHRLLGAGAPKTRYGKPDIVLITAGKQVYIWEVKPISRYGMRGRAGEI